MPHAGPSRTAWIDPESTRLMALIVAVIVLAWSGVRVWRLDANHRAELRGAQTTLESYERWRRSFRPAVAAESASWQVTMRRLQGAVSHGGDRLETTRLVTQAADDAGLSDVRVSITSTDTTALDARLTPEGIRRKPASYGLLLDCRGGLAAVLHFIGQLPPSMSATRLSLVHEAGNARHRIALAVYELTVTNEPFSLGASAVRDHSPRGGDDSGGR